MKNVCHFVPYHKDYHSIHTIHFVWENKYQPFTFLKSESIHKMYYVVKGSGFLHTLGNVQPLSEGDIFFTFPTVPFCIESEKDFSYMYISFVGARGNMIIEKLNISPQNFIFKDCNEVYQFWKNGLDATAELVDLMSESILLYTFTFLGKKLLVKKDADDLNNVALSIKKYIDDHFTDSTFSADSISKEISYNKKYISTLFKKYFGIGIADYLNTVRIQHSCTLMQQGITSIYDISAFCGYSDSQYFSKVFRRKMGMSPREYIRENIKPGASNKKEIL